MSEREKLTEQYVRQVWERLPRFVKPTTFQSTLLLNQALNADVTLASETLQTTGSFKFRAAYNLLAEVEEKEVITASSGNFGQAVAYACMLLGKRCIVIMPQTSSKSKQAAVRAYGGEVELIDVTTKSRAERITELRQEHPQAFYAPPYDHYRVVAGNSTLGREIIERLHTPDQPLDYIVSPIGGGGLISGIITARDILAPQIEVIGAEPLLGNTRTLSVGDLNWEIIHDGIKRIIEVPEEQIAEGLRLLYGKANLKVEPTGALSTGAVLTQPELFRGKRVCLVISGGNVDPDVYVRVLGASN
jgi:threonine dehydratase